VKVGERDVFDLVSTRRRVLQVLLNVPLRINDNRLAGSFIGDEIRSVRQTT
jgi:hypothetical protein